MKDSYCNYGFQDLYVAAFFRAPTSEEMRSFSRLTQEQKNELVLNWASLAGWKVKQVQAEDGQTYVAFAPISTD